MFWFVVCLCDDTLHRSHSFVLITALSRLGRPSEGPKPLESMLFEGLCSVPLKGYCSMYIVRGPFWRRGRCSSSQTRSTSPEDMLLLLKPILRFRVSTPYSLILGIDTRPCLCRVLNPCVVSGSKAIFHVCSDAPEAVNWYAHHGFSERLHPECVLPHSCIHESLIHSDHPWHARHCRTPEVLR